MCADTGAKDWISSSAIQKVSKIPHPNKMALYTFFTLVVIHIKTIPFRSLLSIIFKIFYAHVNLISGHLIRKHVRSPTFTAASYMMKGAKSSPMWRLSHQVYPV